ncbi:non-ribosomal peptide synthetase [Scytonema sp. NUACC26]|uniref:non-ribosomal peptide synthetase n=1 Tax=Scytonema sp. NUACC26 TaxID=3140176 RepID=UPI0034DBA2B0
MNVLTWQNIRVSQAEQRAYWQNQLHGNLPVLDIPSDYPRTPNHSLTKLREVVELNEDLYLEIKKFSRHQKVNMFNLLVAAFKILLFRYTGQEDIIVGSVSADSIREREGFINPVPLRTHILGSLSAEETLRRVAITVKEAAKNRDYPFEELINDLKRDESLAKSPIFQVMLVLCNTPFCVSDAPILEGNIAAFKEHSDKCDLVIFASEEGEGIKISCEYSAELFESASVRRMLGHFQTLLKSIVADPGQSVSTLLLLTEAERHQLLVEWNNTKVDYPREQCIHHLFEAQVKQTPNTVAVVFEDEQLTYWELNHRAEQLAHHLRSLGVGPEVLVGICVERSIEMVVGLLGILKAGGAYVPLDPAYPKERLAFMLSNSQLSILLTQRQFVKNLPENTAKVVLDEPWDASDEETKDIITNVTANNLAYVMYTSGSTGKPKAVSVIHRGVVRLVKGANYVNITKEEVFLQLAPISFDASTFEIWGCLLNGGKLVIFPASKLSLKKLGQTIQQYQVTTLWLTSGLFHLMVDEQLEDLKPVRQLLAGGDVLSVPHIQKTLQKLEGCKLINGYGPTENTTFTCCFSITEPFQFSNSVPIGRPISNTQVYILDRHMQPVPIGVRGELYTGGDGLARGYFNRPELTEEKFIPNPFSDEPGAYLYKTGDLTRYLPDGNIEFLGRIDNQVKIRGFRIELGEIESALCQHPAIKEAAVIVKEDSSSNKHLVAYIVPMQEQELTIHDLRGFLNQKLPDYMMPLAFVQLNSLPLSPNGKVDRRTLSNFTLSRPDSAGPLIAPRNPTEQQLADIWTEVLKTEVGVYDNFFELGGNSLLAAQIVSQLYKMLSVELTVSELFEFTTVAELAAHIETVILVNKEEEIKLLQALRLNGSVTFFAEEGSIELKI